MWNWGDDLESFKARHPEDSWTISTSDVSEGDIIEYWCPKREKAVKARIVDTKWDGHTAQIYEVDEQLYNEISFRDCIVFRLPKPPPIPRRRGNGCECGAQHTSFPKFHSDWCPHYKPRD